MKAHESEQASERQDAVASVLSKGPEIGTITLLLLLALSIGTGFGFASTIPITGGFGTVPGLAGSTIVLFTGPSFHVDTGFQNGGGPVSFAAPGVLGRASGTISNSGKDDFGFYSSGDATLDGQTGMVFGSVSFVTAPYVGPPLGVFTISMVPMTFVGTLDTFEVVSDINGFPEPGPALWSVNVKGSGKIEIDEYPPAGEQVGQVASWGRGTATKVVPESSSLLLVFLTFIAVGALLVRQYRTSRA